ncbi:uncharacterized protein sowahb isoform X2 [Genypterus blacodes]|uniref:uncharacterized protein sowahb isoform X2 n=1 Tax=Genypterus blacodes TaxID=154954 RepID=UPI003F762908
MATDFTQDSLLHFLRSNGDSVRNSDLLLHFRCFLRGEGDQAHNRELFKKFVNNLATVKQVDGVSHVVLRKKFKAHVSGGGGGEFSGARGKSSEPPTGSAHQKPVESKQKPRGPVAGLPEVTTLASQPARKITLPAAGICVNNNNNVETNRISEKHNRAQQQQQQQQQHRLQQQKGDYGLPPGTKPAVRTHGEVTFSQTPTVKEVPRNIAPLCNQELIGEAPQLHPSRSPQDVLRHARHRKSYKNAVSCDDQEEDEEEDDIPRRPGSVGGAWPQATPLSSTVKSISASSPCVTDPSPPSEVISSSSLNSLGRKHELPQIFIEDVEEETPSPRGQRSGSGARSGGQWAGPQMDMGSVPAPSESALTRRSLPLEAMRYTPSPDRAEEKVEHHIYDAHSNPQHSQFESEIGPGHNSRSSSQSGIFSPLSEARVSSSDWTPSVSPRGSGWNSSNEELHTRQDDTGTGARIQDLLMQAKAAKAQSVMFPDESKTTAPWHHSHLHGSKEDITHLSPWRYSTGNIIGDSEEVESSDGSTSSSHLPRRPMITQLVSSNLRSRMCRSLGEDLDRPFPEEVRGGGGGGGDAARLNRLQLISSSLSLPYNLSSSSLSSCSTSPCCHSMADLNEREEEGREGKEAKVRRSLPSTSSSSAHIQHESHRQSLVPLEPREHAWLVKGAAGSWTDIYSLFREDPSLLNRRDFISGFTVLHWIAKHGDHRVLNTLWYGVEKAGVTFDVNVRSVCGHTPLHISAVHGHKSMMRLLVNKFDANVGLRDTAGKKAWQYLNCSTTPDFFEMLGAPPRVAVAAHRPDEGDRSHQKQHRQRRRHHLSSASSGERPLTVAGTVRVKRSSSLAAFLKHKSLRHFHGHQSDSSL